METVSVWLLAFLNAELEHSKCNLVFKQPRLSKNFIFKMPYYLLRMPNRFLEWNSLTIPGFHWAFEKIFGPNNGQFSTDENNTSFCLQWKWDFFISETKGSKNRIFIFIYIHIICISLAFIGKFF